MNQPPAHSNIDPRKVPPTATTNSQPAGKFPADFQIASLMRKASGLQSSRLLIPQKWPRMAPQPLRPHCNSAGMMAYAC